MEDEHKQPKSENAKWTSVTVKLESHSFQKKKIKRTLATPFSRGRLSFFIYIKLGEGHVAYAFPGTVSESAVALANPSLIGTGGLVSPFRRRRDDDVWGPAKLAA